MEIRLGPAGNCSNASSTEDSLKKVNEMGLQAQEIEFVRGVYLNNEKAEKMGKVAKKEGISLSIHAPYYVNLCSKKKKEASMKRILDSAERGEKMGATVVVFHPGYYKDLSKEEAWNRVMEACEEMNEDVEEVKLGLETTGKHSQFGTLDEIMRITEKLENCVPVIDFAHLYAKKYGKIDYGKILDKINELQIDHLHTHFSNIEYTSKGEKKHLKLNGKPPFKPLAKEIIERGLDITLISESPILEKDSLKMKKIFEDLGVEF
ncbi:MAG: TIM barrel protein [Candidatus Aenigmatarchaeota archaeon]